MSRLDGPFPGHPPLPRDEKDFKTEYVVLVGRFGWIIGRWQATTGCFIDTQHNLPKYLQQHHRDDIEWWMPQSGSLKY